MKNRILLILIFIMAFSLRYFKIADYPKTLYGDEQAFAWNAYNILKLGTDEYGTPYPLHFRSFNDYKAPVPVYLLVPVFKVFGMNAWSIRIPIVIASFLTVVVFYFFCRLFLAEKISLLSAFLFSVSPWHVHLSRGYFESTLSLLFFLTGIYCFLKSRLKTGWLILSSFFFTLALYSYFTPRILLPFFLLLLFYIGVKLFAGGKVKSVIAPYLIFIVIFLILTLPMIKLTFFGGGLSRFKKLNDSVSLVITQTVNRERNASLLPLNWRIILHNKATVWLRIFKNNYLEHFSLNFWYLYGDNSLRYFLGNMGMFYLYEMPFLFLGIIYIIKNNGPLAYFLLGWLLLAPLPASLVGRSFAVRSLSILPAPFVFVAAGISFFTLYIRKKIYKFIFIGGLTAAVVCMLGITLVKYYFEYPVYAATWWGWENKAALDYARARESLYDNIFISDYYTGATLAFAVYNRYDPRAFRQAINNPVTLGDNRRFIKLGKYYFGSLDLDPVRLSQNIIPPKSLYIGRPEEPDSSKTINAPDDGRVIFKIYKTD
ncbi:hypothetical protein A3D78_06890 [Candidatus Gottesmanbacteria bacterium RIFCSPHIGHO2_02_FULL_39_14]|uniref:Glycosyltransferase RgtA/B/C/D-like domain-containing protein n=1 Tax=Candidatus Gottesmanbacteria bacterium RIFCSPHIGHO2_02_FULL_39_14 TaxID=1798383 RepID=A0A1F5ZV49_9BACT|nr:MAG: hypothetical protein A3D78_06890 [Candidatus Gottesmanbacteria bacterium RIFCSPHIGHO2_02_FULL_39_14]